MRSHLVFYWISIGNYLDTRFDVDLFNDLEKTINFLEGYWKRLFYNQKILQINSLIHNFQVFNSYVYWNGFLKNFYSEEDLDLLRWLIKLIIQKSVDFFDRKGYLQGDGIYFDWDGFKIIYERRMDGYEV